MKKTFGNILKSILQISDVKKASLALFLNYDPSYLSKWVHDVNLPPSKNIELISEGISEFICENSSDEAILNLGKYFDLKPELCNRENVLNCINNSLIKSYNKKSSSSSNKESYLDTLENNSTTFLYPKNIAMTILSDILENQTYTNIDQIVAYNLFYLNDKMHPINVLNSHLKMNKNNSNKVRFVFTNKNMDKDIINNGVILIYISTLYPSIDSCVYVTNEDINAAITVYNNIVTSIGTYSSPSSFLSINVCKDKDFVNKMFFAYDCHISEKCIPLFKRINPFELISNKIFNTYIFGNNLSCIIGTLNELFISPKLFSDLSNLLFEPELKVNLHEINTALNSVTYNSNLKVIFRKVDIINFLSTGVIHFFNKETTLSTDERAELLSYMTNLFETHNNIEVSIIDYDLSPTLPQYHNFTLYLSSEIVMTKSHANNIKNDFFILQDSLIQEGYINMFDEIWSQSRNKPGSSKKDAIDFFRNMSRYCEAINEASKH